MTDKASSGSDPSDAISLPGLALADGVPLLVLCLLTAVSLAAGRAFGFSYAGGIITDVLLLSAALWLGGRGVRTVMRSRPLTGHVVECIGLLMALSLMASITSAVLAASGLPLVDDNLAALDRLLLPSLPWPDMVAGLKQYPSLNLVLSHVYLSLNWQPLALTIVVLATGRGAVLRKFVAAWAISIAICILPFYWLPAIGPYPHFAVSNGPEYGHMVDLAFQTPGILGTLRGGGPLVISEHTITGLVCMPSFHACSAGLLAWAFWSWRLLRWPMAALNGTMIVAAVPIGGHYYVDVIAGSLAAVVCATAIELLVRWQRLQIAVPAPVA